MRRTRILLFSPPILASLLFAANAQATLIGSEVTLDETLFWERTPLTAPVVAGAGPEFELLRNFSGVAVAAIDITMSTVRMDILSTLHFAGRGDEGSTNWVDLSGLVWHGAPGEQILAVEVLDSQMTESPGWLEATTLSFSGDVLRLDWGFGTSFFAGDFLEIGLILSEPSTPPGDSEPPDPVPVTAPATFALLGSGLIAIVMQRRWRSARRDRRP